jgi:hypothetical protein
MEHLVLCAAICAELRLSLKGRLDLVLGVGDDEGDELVAEVAEHVQEIGLCQNKNYPGSF